jgi:hypothetical protein
MILISQLEERFKTSDGHVGKAKEMVKDDTKLLLEDFPIVSLQTILGWWEMGPHWVIDQLELQPRIRRPIAQVVKELQCTNTLMEGPFTPLLVYIYFRVAGEGADQLDLISLEETRQIVLPRLKDDREIASIHDMAAKLDTALHEIIEMRVELGRSPRDIHRGNIGPFQETQYRIHRLQGHHFLPRWPRLHMAVQACLVAVLAHVDLQDIHLSLAKAVTVLSYLLSKALHGHTSLG